MGVMWLDQVTGHDITVPLMTPEALLIGRVKPGVLLSISPGPVHLTFIAPILWAKHQDPRPIHRLVSFDSKTPVRFFRIWGPYSYIRKASAQ
jgi:hypothetical protein